jgi:hypothetical protein
MEKEKKDAFEKMIESGIPEEDVEALLTMAEKVSIVHEKFMVDIMEIFHGKDCSLEKKHPEFFMLVIAKMNRGFVHLYDKYELYREMQDIEELKGEERKEKTTQIVEKLVSKLSELIEK